MEAQVNVVAKWLPSYHLQLVHQLTPYLSISNLATVIHAMDTSRSDFCNSLYTGLPLNLI